MNGNIRNLELPVRVDDDGVFGSAYLVSHTARTDLSHSLYILVPSITLYLSNYPLNRVFHIIYIP